MATSTDAAARSCQKRFYVITTSKTHTLFNQRCALQALVYLLYIATSYGTCVDLGQLGMAQFFTSPAGAASMAENAYFKLRTSKYVFRNFPASWLLRRGKKTSVRQSRAALRQCWHVENGRDVRPRVARFLNCYWLSFNSALLHCANQMSINFLAHERGRRLSITC